MQTTAPCPGETFIGTPMTAWASAALNFEHGSILATGDWGCTSALEAEDGVGEFAPLLEDGPLQEHSKKEANIALNMID